MCACLYVEFLSVLCFFTTSFFLSFSKQCSMDVIVHVRTFDLRILAILWVVKRAQALLISRVNLMVGRLAGRLFTCGGLIATGTFPIKHTSQIHWSDIEIWLKTV